MQVTYTEEEYNKYHGFGNYTCADSEQRKMSAAWKEREDRRKKLQSEFVAASNWLQTFNNVIV